VSVDFDERVARLEARASILDVAARYCHGADGRNEEVFMSVWHPDAVWDVGSHRFVGHDQILEAVSRQWSTFRSMHHVTSNSVVELIDPHGARGRHDVVSLTTLADGQNLLTVGQYEDSYSLRSGSWRIEERRASVATTVNLSSEFGELGSSKN
jgi:hypothetical protein